MPIRTARVVTVAPALVMVVMHVGAVIGQVFDCVDGVQVVVGHFIARQDAVLLEHAHDSVRCFASLHCYFCVALPQLFAVDGVFEQLLFAGGVGNCLSAQQVQQMLAARSAVLDQSLLRGDPISLPLEGLRQGAGLRGGVAAVRGVLVVGREHGQPLRRRVA